MLRAKAHQFKEGKLRHPARDPRPVLEPIATAKLATIPVVVHFVNAASHSKPLRAIGEKVMHVDKDAWCSGVHAAQVPSRTPRRASRMP
jgi:hypothetical protein